MSPLAEQEQTSRWKAIDQVFAARPETPTSHDACSVGLPIGQWREIGARSTSRTRDGKQTSSGNAYVGAMEQKLAVNYAVTTDAGEYTRFLLVLGKKKNQVWRCGAGLGGLSTTSDAG